MIGKRQNLISLLVVLIINITIGYSQTNFGEKAMSYFCSDVVVDISVLENIDIVFKGYTNGYPAKVYDVADCLGDVNLIKDSIPNRQILDDLEKELSEMKFNKRKIDVPCDRLKKKVFLKRDVFYMTVYESIQYKENNVVEIFLLNKKRQMYVVVVIEFDNSNQVSNFCTRQIRYE